MEALTQAVVALVLGRAVLNRLAASAMWAVLALSLLMDADLLSRNFGAAAFLEWRRTATHSLAGVGVLAPAVAVAYWLMGRRRKKRPVRLLPAVATCLAGAGMHLVVALLDVRGAQLLWPVRRDWFAWDLLEPIDPWMLLLLAGGLLLPGLFHLVSEEIGAGSEPRLYSRGALAALLLIALYCGSRALFQLRAKQMLDSHLYHGAAPLAVGVFPASASPLEWRGVVETEATLEVFELDATGAGVPSSSAQTHYKPEPTPVLEAARNTKAVRQFLPFARFPLARVVRLVEGYRVEIRDLRFEPSQTRPAPVAVVEVDEKMQVTDQRIEFTFSP